MLRILEAAGTVAPMAGTPHVMLIVGVNGVGKTTTIGKLRINCAAKAGRR
jgi:signal recognition particle GTPase